MKIRAPMLLLLLMSSGCGSDEKLGGQGDEGPDLLAGTVPATFVLSPGVETATITEAAPGAPLTLYNAEGTKLITVIADEFGQAHFAYVPFEHITLDSQGGSTELPVSDGETVRPGDGYVIRNDSTDPVEASPLFTVLAVDDVPDASHYEEQELNGIHFGLFGLGEGETEADGFNYIEMRDGVKLSAMIRFPDAAIWGDGPYPTVIEYSGYSPSRPSSPEPGSRIATLLGYATVGVNMRGTGCSGGVFDVFNPAQHADGYDIVEAVARQPWVLHNKVGMVGLSYSGIAQLFVGRSNPPSLSAITPLSVIADPWEQLWPGGIYNDGFSRQWIEERDKQAAPGGQSWTAKRIEAGDTICEAHQQLRNQNIDFATFFRQLEFYPRPATDRSLPLLIDEIDVPVYLTGAWQDEQTGPQFADMLSNFTGTSTKKFTLFNGRHPDGYSPLVLTRWLEFLEFYVAKRVPKLPDFVRTIGGQEFSKEFGVEGLGFEDDRFPQFTENDYDAALAAYESEPTVRVLFESGGGGPEPGAPASRFEASFDAWPPPSAEGRSFYLGADGTITDAAPSSSGIDSYLHDPDAGGSTFFGPSGYQLLVPLWDIDWTEFPAGRSLSYLTAPLTEDTVVAGPGYADLWFASDVDDAIVQVTITEVRPDGNEYLVTSGWLRLGHRAVDETRSDEFRIRHPFTEDDFLQTPAGEFVNAQVALPSVAHAFRATSRLRVIVSTPGRNHGTWEFAPPDYGGATPKHLVARSPDMPSRLYLPIVNGISVAAGFPDCPGLRGQPCRPYTPSSNTTE